MTYNIYFTYYILIFQDGYLYDHQPRNKPELIDYEDMYYNKTPGQRFEISFDVVEQNYAVPQLLDVEGS